MVLQKYDFKDLNEVFSRFKDPRIQRFHALKHLQDLYVRSSKGLDDNEKNSSFRA